MKIICFLIPTFFAIYFSHNFKTVDIYKLDTTSQNTISQNDTSKYATFYVYRSKKWKYHLDVYSVNVGDSVVYRIKSNSKHAVKIFKEGPIEVWAKSGGKMASLNFNVQFGKEYYIKCTIDAGFAMGYPELTEMSRQEGKTEWDAIPD